MSNNSMNGKILDVVLEEDSIVSSATVDGEANASDRNDAIRKINISMPAWMVDELDAVARHYAVSRQAIINLWIAERLTNVK